MPRSPPAFVLKAYCGYFWLFLLLFIFSAHLRPEALCRVTLRNFPTFELISLALAGTAVTSSSSSNFRGVNSSTSNPTTNPTAMAATDQAGDEQLRQGRPLQLCVFDERRGEQEGQEQDKLLGYYPAQVPLQEQGSVVGLAQALLTFTNTFQPVWHSPSPSERLQQAVSAACYCSCGSSGQYQCQLYCRTPPVKQCTQSTAVGLCTAASRTFGCSL